MIDWESLSHIARDTGLLHLGFLTVAFAYLVRDVLRLRLLAALGYALFLAEGVSAGGMPNTPLLAWYAVFLVVNLVHAWRLARERRREHLTTEECQLADLAFKSLSTAAARRLMRRGRWCHLADGAQLIEQGTSGNAIYAIAEGTIEVVVDGKPIASARAGQLVGEVGFLAGGPATASAIARGPVRALVWDRARLQRAMDRSDVIHDAVYAAFGHDLARKVAEQSLRPRQEARSASP